MLVTIGIITLLISLLIPAVTRVQRSSRQAVCLVNLRQWVTAATTYAMDYDGYLPRRGQGQQPTTLLTRPEDWFNMLPPVMKKEPYSQLVAMNRIPHSGDGGIWICLEAAEIRPGAVYTDAVFTYGMNMRLSTWQAPKPDQINNLGDLTSMVFMADGPTSYCSILPAAADFSPVARHSGWVNISFLDGHVASFTGDSVGCGKGDPLRVDVRWVVPSSSWKGPTP